MESSMMMEVDDISLDLPLDSNDQEFTDLWAPIEKHIADFLINPNSQMSVAHYMDSYSAIYGFCTKTMTIDSENHGYNGTPCRIDFPLVRGAQVYNGLRRAVTRYCRDTAAYASGLGGGNLLHFYHTNWARFLKLAKIIDHMMAYLNRVWVPQSAATRGPVCRVFEMVLRVWRDSVFATISDKLTHGLIFHINAERNGGPSDDGTIKGILLSYLELDFSPEVEVGSNANSYGPLKESSERSVLYRSKFEDVFLTATSKFYEAESAQILAVSPVSEYIRLAHSRLLEESERVVRYLMPHTKRPLISLCQARLIKDHDEKFILELRRLLRENSNEDIQLLFRLVSNIPALLEPLRQTFEVHVRQYGLDAVEKVARDCAQAQAGGNAGAPAESLHSSCTDIEMVTRQAQGTANSEVMAIVGAATPEEAASLLNVDAKTYVDSILAVREKYVNVVANAFGGDQGFMAAMDKACREFVNSNVVCRTSSRSPELIARYTDILLKRSPKNIDEEILENALSSVLIAFKYIEDKDVFQKFYARLLCKRLVYQQSVGDELERWMISRLKDACGYEYISKLQRMFTDVELSRDLNEAFRVVLPSGACTVDFHAMVLSTASWPLSPGPGEFRLPPELVGASERFCEFYNGRFNGRRLKWLYNHSRCEMKAQFDPARPAYTLQVNMYQMRILLRFNTSDSYSLSEMLTTTNLDQTMVEGNLVILVKARILNFVESVGSAPRYALNLQYRNKKMRINLNVTIRSEIKAEIVETHKTVEDDRRFLIQAAIVRVMKTRRTMKHTQLVQEVLEQLTARFRPGAQDIKKAIAELMAKDYIERVDNQKDSYSYIA